MEASIPTRIEQTFLRRVQEAGLIRPGERVLVALSGGADSVALLHLLLAAAPHLDCEVAAAHLDHAIREQSTADAAFVQHLCARVGIELYCERRDVPAMARQGKVGLEEAGRAARREFLLAIAARCGCASIALGHHRGDQAETVVHHLARGCAVSGLAAMRSRSGRFIRPLLEFSRAELRHYLAARGEGFVEDDSNRDLSFTRNRIRHELLPALAAFNPRIEEALAMLAQCAGREEDYWERELERMLPVLVHPEQDGVWLPLPELRALHPALCLRLLRHVLMASARQAGKEITATHLDAVLRLLHAAEPQVELDLPGCWVARRYDRLWLRAHRPLAPAVWQVTLSGPGSYPLPGGAVLTVALVATGDTDTLDRWTACFDAAATPFPLTVRCVRPGDRMRLSGMDGHKRIKELLMERRLSREERQRVMVVDGPEILWLAGLRRCGDYPPRPGATVLKLVLDGGCGRERP